MPHVGAIGLLLAQVAKAAGCKVILIDLRALSLDLAKKEGWADHTVNASTDKVSSSKVFPADGSEEMISLSHLPTCHLFGRA